MDGNVFEFHLCRGNLKVPHTGICFCFGHTDLKSCDCLLKGGAKLCQLLKHLIIVPRGVLGRDSSVAESVGVWGGELLAVF